MRMLWVAAAVVAFTVAGGVKKANAYYFDGSKLLEHCESDDASQYSVCIGYLMAFADTTDRYVAWGAFDKRICPPPTMITSQLEKVVIKGLNEAPELLHNDASGLVHNILVTAFPCD